MTTQAIPGQNPAKGILFYMTGIFFMATMDVIAKLVAQDVHVAMAVWARYAGQTALVTLIFLPNLRTIARTRYPFLQFLRSAFLLMGTSLFFLSLTKLDLAEATAIMDINPILITLGGALLLGETFGPRRAFGVGAALIGALIIIRPGTDVFSPAAFLPLIAATGYASFVLITRKVGHDEDPRTSLFYAALLGALATTLVVPFFWETPAPFTIFLMLLIGVAGSLGQFFLIRAVQFAEAGAIAPFSYLGLLIAAFWGMVIFGEYPDLATWIGATIIVIAGVYVWHRERVT
ncbi:DMT family transporter [Maritimibacter dapengensis]|uniref:DMT family transporter n=1 Tax=Maritimibacter dapengensis TaxID=2836868 RepID=A0ABS6T190_9RHOB|nr:DMT family transporter [Maritimibacter dapengensis]MBV7378361.1 DMT family transporter [Maritimibacter dapengensis]